VKATVSAFNVQSYLLFGPLPVVMTAAFGGRTLAACGLPAQPARGPPHTNRASVVRATLLHGRIG